MSDLWGSPIGNALDHGVGYTYGGYRDHFNSHCGMEVVLPDGHMPWSGHMALFSAEAVYARIKAVRTALVFVNTRSQAEMLFQELWRINEDSLPIALHHGSLDRETRNWVEKALREGQLKSVVCLCFGT